MYNENSTFSKRTTCKIWEKHWMYSEFSSKNIKDCQIWVWNQSGGKLVFYCTNICLLETTYRTSENILYMTIFFETEISQQQKICTIKESKINIRIYCELWRKYVFILWLVISARQYFYLLCYANVQYNYTPIMFYKQRVLATMISNDFHN